MSLKHISVMMVLLLSITACKETSGSTEQGTRNENNVISSTDAVYADMAQAKSITLSAFTLSPDGRMAATLEAAAKRGANVSVALDGQAFGGARENNTILAPILEGMGVHVHYSVGPSHLKAAVIDSTRTYLSDRNWTTGGMGEIVLLDPYPGDRILVERAMLGYGGHNEHLWLVKQEALHAEAGMISTRTSSGVDIQTESFGAGTEVYNEIVERAQRGDHIRLIVATTEYNRSRSEQRVVSDLVQRGVQVKLNATGEKMAIEGVHSWVGSANLTKGLPDQIDFGFIFENAAITDQVEQKFQRNWLGSTEVR